MDPGETKATPVAEDEATREKNQRPTRDKKEQLTQETVNLDLPSTSPRSVRRAVRELRRNTALLGKRSPQGTQQHSLRGQIRPTRFFGFFLARVARRGLRSNSEENQPNVAEDPLIFASFSSLGVMVANQWPNRALAAQPTLACSSVWNAQGESAEYHRSPSAKRPLKETIRQLWGNGSGLRGEMRAQVPQGLVGG